MNKWIGMGRLTREPDIRYSQSGVCVARYTLAVDKRFKKDGGQTADFISCVAFGKQGEFASQYLHQGTKIVVSGRIETGSYTNRDGQKVYTTDVIIEEQDFAESKQAESPRKEEPEKEEPKQEGFMDIPDDIENELPFV